MIAVQLALIRPIAILHIQADTEHMLGREEIYGHVQRKVLIWDWLAMGPGMKTSPPNPTHNFAYVFHITST